MRKLKTTELERINVEEFRDSRKVPLTVILEDVRSMLNVGSAFRTCDAFRIKKLILCGITAKPPHREITKSALGATESVEWIHFESVQDAIDSLDPNTRIIAIEQVENSKSLTEFDPNWDNEYAIIFGNEVEGVSEKALESSASALEIPQYGTKHSLNVSVSIGIVLWQFVKGYKFE